MIFKLNNCIRGVYCTNSGPSGHICHNVVHSCLLLLCHKQLSDVGFTSDITILTGYIYIFKISLNSLLKDN